MAMYEYRCRTCDSGFEVRRSVTAEAQPVQCPQGHDEAVRVWSAVSVTGRAGSPVPVASGGGGGCCGGGCCG